MTKENFIKLLKEYRQFNKKIQKLYEFGLDLFELKYNIVNNVENIIEITLSNYYNHEQISVIYEYMFDHNCNSDTLLGEFITLKGYNFDDSRKVGNFDDLYNLIEELL